MTPLRNRDADTLVFVRGRPKEKSERFSRPPQGRAGPVDRRELPRAGSRRTRPTAARPGLAGLRLGGRRNFFRRAPTECRFGALRNDISTEGQPSLTDS